MPTSGITEEGGNCRLRRFESLGDLYQHLQASSSFITGNVAGQADYSSLQWTHEH